MERNFSARLMPFGVVFTVCISVLLGLTSGKGTTVALNASE